MEIRQLFGIEPAALNAEEAATSSVSELLTNSELARLQQQERELSDYARKGFTSSGK